MRLLYIDVGPMRFDRKDLVHQSDVKIQTPYEINAEGMRMSRVYDDVIISINAVYCDMDSPST